MTTFTRSFKPHSRHSRQRLIRAIPIRNAKAFSATTTAGAAKTAHRLAFKAARINASTRMHVTTESYRMPACDVVQRAREAFAAYRGLGRPIIDEMIVEIGRLRAKESAQKIALGTPEMTAETIQVSRSHHLKMSDIKSAQRFVFSDKPATVIWPCIVSVPKDGGVREEQTITTRFKVLPGDELKSLSDEGGDKKVLDAVIVGFVDLCDQMGAPVRDDVAKAALLNLPYCVLAFVEGYYAMLGGRVAKN